MLCWFPSQYCIAVFPDRTSPQIIRAFGGHLDTVITIQIGHQRRMRGETRRKQAGRRFLKTVPHTRSSVQRQTAVAAHLKK